MRSEFATCVISPDSAGLVVKPAVAGKQLDAEVVPPPPPPPQLRRFHGSVRLDSARVGRDAGRIADEVIAHLLGQMGAEVAFSLEIDARLPNGVSDQLVRTVTENSRRLKFDSHGFEPEQEASKGSV
jgi:hypothetical protein